MQGLAGGDGGEQPDFAKMMADMQGSAPSGQLPEGDSDDEEELPALSEVKDDK
ncbi:hypothetical protein BCR37DRAFT_377465 [Protomyces lactucae-debilis]|uniref:Uncharacterized protein n=1 Tax=Protomyces lactucae-debilis TaxID=2754530 RepID=A0A1Y2FR10_PROLT|nr:uncharacterized protein BCR37DRAFT_377465 [Protomyces lactucae-debilis]ORY85754.1 hypothetical protein BCR37DRAFT_377465 [Protomyces lactucae-debilis]